MSDSGRKFPIFPPLDLADPSFGLKLDGVTDDGAQLNTIMGAGSGEFWLPSGANLSFSTPIVVPVASVLRVGAGAVMTCRVTGGANAISLDHDAALLGVNKGGQSSTNKGSVVNVVAGANVGALVTHVHTDATQEYAYVDDIMLWASGGAVASLLTINGSLGFNAGFRGIVFRCNNIATSALVIKGGTGGAPNCLPFTRCWFNGSAGHLIVIDTPGGSHAPSDIWFTHCGFEGWATGFDGFNLGATGNVFDINVRDSHVERFATDGSATNVFDFISVMGAEVQGVTVVNDGGANANLTVANIGSSVNNQGINVDSIRSIGSVTLLNDQGKSVTKTGTYLDQYRNAGAVAQIFQVGTAPAPNFSTAGWGQQAGGWEPLSYFIDSQGLLHIGGACTTTNGTATDGTSIFTLPAGYRPVTIHPIPCIRTDSSTSTCLVQVNSAGVVQYSGTALAAAASLHIPDTALHMAI